MRLNELAGEIIGHMWSFLLPKDYVPVCKALVARYRNYGSITLDSSCTDQQFKGCMILLKAKKIKVNILKCNQCNLVTNWETLEGFSLRKLIFSCCTDENVNTLTNLVNLLELDLKGSKITDKGLFHVAKMKNLTFLILTNCVEVSDEGVILLGELENLEKLSLGGCIKISDKGIRGLKGLKHLNGLDLGRCNKITNKGINDLTTFGLKDLGLQQSNATDEWIDDLLQLRKLQKLLLYECRVISDKGISKLIAFAELEHLDLCVCNVTDACMDKLGKLYGLRVLKLRACHMISDEGISKLVDLNKLEWLEIGYCNGISRVGLKSLDKLDRLQSLACGGSNLSDIECIETVTKGFKNLKFLSVMNHLNVKLSQDMIEQLRMMNSLHKVYFNNCIGYDNDNENFRDTKITLDSGFCALAFLGRG